MLDLHHAIGLNRSDSADRDIWHDVATALLTLSKHASEHIRSKSSSADGALFALGRVDDDGVGAGARHVKEEGQLEITRTRVTHAGAQGFHHSVLEVVLVVSEIRAPATTETRGLLEAMFGHRLGRKHVANVVVADQVDIVQIIVHNHGDERASRLRHRASRLRHSQGRCRWQRLNLLQRVQ